MRVIGHGVDLVEVRRIGRMVEEHGERFLARVFTEAERAYAERRQGRFEHLAARFAAKEAAFKALGTGWTRGVAWTDVGVARTPDGVPTLALEGRAGAIAREIGVASWQLSLTHAGGLAMASVLALAD